MFCINTLTESTRNHTIHFVGNTETSFTTGREPSLLYFHLKYCHKNIFLRSKYSNHFKTNNITKNVAILHESYFARTICSNIAWKLFPRAVYSINSQEPLPKGSLIYYWMRVVSQGLFILLLFESRFPRARNKHVIPIVYERSIPTGVCSITT